MSIVSNVAKNIVSNFVKGISYIDGVKVVTVAYNGDSLAEFIAEESANTDRYIEVSENLGMTVLGIEDAARGGAGLTKSTVGSSYFWDDTTSSIGNIYNLEWNSVDKDNITDAILSFGTNDNVGVPDNLTSQEYEDAFVEYMNYLLSDLTSLQRIHVRPLNRHENSDKDINWEGVRKAIYNAVDRVPNAYIMGESYDLTLVDTVHLTDAGELVQVERDAKRVAYITGNYSKPMLGMEITSASINDEGIICTIKHHDGDDWTVGGSESWRLFYVESDGVGVSISGSDVTKIDATTLKINCGAITDPQMVVLWGTLSGLGLRNIATALPKDNSENQLPLRRSSVTPTDTDLIRSIDNLAYELRPSYIKTYDSGLNISQVKSINGKTFSNLNSGQFMEYDSTAFGGAGGLRSSSLNTILSVDNGFASQETLMIGMTIEVPQTLSGNGYLFTFGTSNTISTQAQFYITSAGQIRYSVNEGNGQDIIGGDLRGGRHALIFNFTAFDNCDVYLNDVTAPLASFDPRNTYAFQNDLMFGGGQNGCAFGQFFAKLGSHDPINDPSLSDIMDNMKTRYNVS